MMKYVPNLEEYEDEFVTGNEVIVSTAISMDRWIEDLRYAMIHDPDKFHRKLAEDINTYQVMLLELGCQNDELMELVKVYVPKGMKIAKRRNPYFNGERRIRPSEDDPNVDHSGAAFHNTPEPDM